VPVHGRVEKVMEIDFALFQSLVETDALVYLAMREAWGGMTHDINSKSNISRLFGLNSGQFLDDSPKYGVRDPQAQNKCFLIFDFCIVH